MFLSYQQTLIRVWGIKPKSMDDTSGDSIHRSVEIAKAAAKRIGKRSRLLLAELEVLRAENERLWGSVQDSGTIASNASAGSRKSMAISPPGTLRKRDSLRLRRSSLRLSFRESRKETPREKLQDLQVGAQLRAKLNETLLAGTAIQMWVRPQHHELHLVFSNRGAKEKVTLTAREEDDWRMLNLWAGVKGVEKRD